VSLRLDDLPPALRKQVDAQLGAKPRRSRTLSRERVTGRCWTCGVEFTPGAWERHADANPGHARFELVAAPS
jgi:hypothetical protein